MSDNTEDNSKDILSKLKLVEGYSKDTQVGKSKKYTLPPAPSSLSTTAKQEYTRLGKVLVKAGLFDDIDRPALAIYANTYALWVKANNKLNKEGESIVKVSPKGGEYFNNWYHVMRKAEDRMLKLIHMFGMSPASRIKLKSEGNLNTKDSHNPFDYI